MNSSFPSCSSSDSTYTQLTPRESFDSCLGDEGHFLHYGSAPGCTMSGGGNLALQDYQMQMFLEQPSQKRFMPTRHLEMDGPEMPGDLPEMSTLNITIDYDKVPQEPLMFNYQPIVTGPAMFQAYNGLQIIPDHIPALVPDLQSPMSDMTSSQGDFINPSQTFMDIYDHPSPANIAQYSSPVSDYSQYPSSSYLEEIRSCSTTPSKLSPLRQPTRESLEASAALHCAQSANANNQRRLVKKPKRQNHSLGPNLRYQERPKKPCGWPGCNRKFQRQEHLKRHLKTHTNSDAFRCEFCDRLFGRSDNLKAHILLHTKTHKSRTDYYERAIEVYENLNQRGKRSSYSTVSIMPEVSIKSESNL